MFNMRNNMNYNNMNNNINCCTNNLINNCMNNNMNNMNINKNMNLNNGKIINLLFMTEEGKKYLITVNSENRLYNAFEEFKKKINNAAYNNLNQLNLLFKGKNIVGKFINNEKVSSLNHRKLSIIKVVLNLS